MTPTPPGVELLAQAVTYTRSTLAAVSLDDLARPTPCDGWRLADLLAHLDDALDAFTEAADGQVWLSPASPALLGRPVATADELRAKAQGLVRAWRRPAPVGPVVGVGGVEVGGVEVGGVGVDPTAVVLTAALEVAVHGNDVARSVRDLPARDLRRLPGPLARGLAGAADVLAPADDRTGRFGPRLAVPPGADDSARLLAHLGRVTGTTPD